MTTSVAELVIGSDETDLIHTFQHSDLKEPFDNISIENLRDNENVGDAIIRYGGEPVWLIERKELNDMASSLRDGRWRNQHARMSVYAATRGCRILYVIEGHSSKLANAHGWLRAGSPVWPLRTALANKMNRDLVRVWRTESIGETAQFLSELARSVAEHGFGRKDPPLREDAYKYMSIKKSESVTHKNCTRMMLAQMPGLGAKNAQTIADHYGSMARLVRAMDECDDQKAQVKALTALPGIGKKRAVGLLEMLYGDEVEPAAQKPVVPTTSAPRSTYKHLYQKKHREEMASMVFDDLEIFGE